MTFFAGDAGFVRLRRTTQATSFSSIIEPVDINLPLNRLGFDGSLQNILTGDRIVIDTADGSPLLCFPADAWPAGDGQIQSGITAYVNVNLYGGLRFFYSFVDAVNNDRTKEIDLTSITASIPIVVTIEDTDFNLQGSVTGFTFQTERESIDITTLSDKFRQQYSAGLISGNGSIDALFNIDNVGTREDSLLLVQLIQRVEIGSGFQAELFVMNRNEFGSNLDVFYQVDAVITRAGVEVRGGDIISCSIDFVATGEINLRVGRAPLNLVTQESTAPIYTKFFEVDELLQEIDD